MAKAIRFTNDTYLSSTGAEYGKEKLSVVLTEMRNPSFCEIGGGSDTTLNFTASYGNTIRYPFDNLIWNNGSDFSFVNNTILVQTDKVHGVRISGAINIDTVDDQIQLNIYKNESIIFTIDSPGRVTGMSTLIIPPLIWGCANGDYFRIQVGCGNVGQRLTRRCKSWFLVEKVL